MIRIKILAKPGFRTKKNQSYSSPKILYETLKDNYSLEIIEFSVFKLIFSDYTHVHLHWPDNIFSSSNFTIRFFKLIGFLFLCLFITLRGKSMAWFSHNIRPHNLKLTSFEVYLFYSIVFTFSEFIFCPNPYAYRFIRKLSHQYNVQVKKCFFGDWSKIIESTSTSATSQSFSQIPDNYILCFGLVRPYKGFHNLPKLTSKCTSNFLIAGYCSDVKYCKYLSSEISHYSNIKWVNEFITDSDLILLIKNSQACFFPFEKISNSGSIRLALTLSTPVITSSNNISLMYKRKFPDFVYLYKTNSLSSLVNCIASVSRSSKSIEWSDWSWDIAAQSVFEAMSAQ